MIVVLDTSVLWDQRLIRELSAARAAELRERGHLKVILPALVLAERQRQLAGSPEKEQAWETALEEIDPLIEPFDEETARRVGTRAPEDDAWHAHARDHLIAAHVHGDRIAVTDDTGPAWGPIPTLNSQQAALGVAALIGE